MPRKPLDVRKAYGRLFANGSKKLLGAYQLKINHSRLLYVLDIYRVRHVNRIKGKVRIFVKAYRSWSIVDNNHFIVEQPYFFNEQVYQPFRFLLQREIVKVRNFLAVELKRRMKFLFCNTKMIAFSCLL